MDVINQVNGTLNQGLNVVNNNKMASTLLGLFLVLYASLAAPNLPSSVTVIFKNNWFRLAFMLLIAYIATKDTSLAIITTVAFLVTLLTLSAQETTSTVVKAVEKKINANIENFAAAPALSTSDYDQLQDYSLFNSDDRIHMGSGTISTPDIVFAQNLSDGDLSGINQAMEEKRAIEARNHVFRGNLGGDTYIITGEHNSGSVVHSTPDLPNMTVSKIKKVNFEQDHPKMENVEIESVVEDKTDVEETGIEETDVEEDASFPTLLELVTGFENVVNDGEVLPFSGSTHYDVELNETKVQNHTRVHTQKETFQDETNELELAGSCGGAAGLTVPGYDLGEFAQYQI